MQEVPQGKTGLPVGTARDTAKTRVIEYDGEQNAVQRKECEVCVVCGGFTRKVECIGLKDAYNLNRQTGLIEFFVSEEALCGNTSSTLGSDLGSNPSSTTYRLCDPVQVPRPFKTLVFSPIKWE